MVLDKQRRTFLSYSRANKDFALKLARELKAEGFSVWLDQLDIPAGARWDREVEKALKESEIFMIILTPASINSENVLDEIGYAIDNGKRILPVLLENCEVPLRLRRFQYVDFTTKGFNDGVQSAKELLQHLIAQLSPRREELVNGSSGQAADTPNNVLAIEGSPKRATVTETTLKKFPGVRKILGVAAVLIVIVGLAYNILTNLENHNLPVPTAPPETVVIPFSDSINSENLNSVFIWQPGSSTENSHDLELNPDELTLIAGAYTDQWQLTTSAPLVTYPITGNFEVQVRVHCSPTENYQIAGLGIRSTENQNSWARIARAYFDGQIVGISDHRNGQESFGEGVPFSRDTVYLKILRYESLLTFSYSMNGMEWVSVEKDLVVDLPPEVEIYLFAFSAQNNSGFIARFKDFSITKK